MNSTEADRNTVNTDTVRWVSALAAVAGMGLAFSPFLATSPLAIDATDTTLWNNTLIGTAIFLLAGYNYYQLSRGEFADVRIALLASILGLWAMISAYVIEISTFEIRASTVMFGLIAVICSTYTAYTNYQADIPIQRGIHD